MTEYSDFDEKVNGAAGAEKQGLAANDNAPPVTLDAGLRAIDAVIKRFVWLTEEQRTICTLWAGATYLVSCVDKAPVLLVTAATFGIGKTDLMRILKEAVQSGSLVAMPTPASIYRKKSDNSTDNEHDAQLGQQCGTRLFDELDEDILRDIDRIINASFTRGVQLERCNAKYKVETFDLFGFKALALRGSASLAADTESRCLRIHIRQKPKGEKIETLDFSDPEHLATIQAMKAKFDAAAENHWKTFKPPKPDGRIEAKWSPLYIMAGEAGEYWLERLKKAIEATAPTPLDERARFLRDVHARRAKLPPQFKARMVVELLAGDKDLEWADLTAKKAGRWLNDFGLEPKTLDGYAWYKVAELDRVTANLAA